MKYRDNILDVAALQPDYMGFIFYPGSRRFVGNHLDVDVVNSLSKATKKVGVFVDQDVEIIKETVVKYQLDYVQLHGNESPEDCRMLFESGIHIIKAFGIQETFDFAALNDYQPYCNYYLFDTHTAQHGGSGKQFNWKLLQAYDNQLPFFLSGGIGLENVPEINQIKDQFNIHAIDVNSRFEEAPGMKIIQQLQELKKCLT